MHSIAASWITGPAIWAYARARTAAWDRAARDPRRSQTSTLRSLCRAARNTEVGRAHRLGEIASHEDFVARVPLGTFESVEPQLARMRGGARDVLWPGLVRYFARSAGTSRRGVNWKYLPISSAQIAWQRRQMFDILSRYLTISGDRRFTGGYSLGLLPPPTIAWEGEIGLTSNPGLVQRMMPPLARRFTLPRSPIADIDDYSDKFDAVADAYLDHDVRSISGTTCWFGVFFDRVIAAARARGRHVSRVAEVWPNLRVLFGGGVNAEAYRGVLDERVGRHTILIDNYNATEGGALAVTDRPGASDLLVLPDRGVFFEFVPRSDVDRGAGARRLPLWEVEPGVEYAVAVTTSSGLFAYLLGDVVRFTSVFPHRLVFCGRTCGEISLTHEKTTHRQIEDAVGRAAARHPCTIAEFAAAGEIDPASTLGRYVLFVEFDRPPADASAFADAVDAEMRQENHLYRLSRNNQIGLLPLELVPLARGTTQRFAAVAGRTGLQQKFPRILDGAHRDLLRTLAQHPAS